MKDLQQKVLDKIESIINQGEQDRGYKLEMVIDKDFANTGSIFAQPKNSFENVFQLRYNFQSDYATMKLTVAKNIRIKEYHLEFSRPSTFAIFFDDLNKIVFEDIIKHGR